MEERTDAHPEAAIAALQLALNLLRRTAALAYSASDYERALHALERAHSIETQVSFNREQRIRIEELEALIAKELRAAPVLSTTRVESSSTFGRSMD